MVLILGTSLQGPTDSLLRQEDWVLYSNKKYTLVDFSTSGSMVLDGSDYRFVRRKRLNYWETNPKPAGTPNTWRLKGFDILPNTLTSDVPITVVDLESGLVRATNPSYISYTANSGRLEEVSPIDEVLVDDTLSWIGGVPDKVWLEQTTPSSDSDLVTCFSNGNFSPDTLALRVDGGTAAICTITPDLVFQADVGVLGNDWRACADTDAVYIIKPPSYPVQRINIPFSQEAADYLKVSEITTPENLVDELDTMVYAVTDLEIDAPTGILEFKGGTTAPPNWEEVLNMGYHEEIAIVPLGLKDIGIASRYLDQTYKSGVWPLVIMDTEPTGYGHDHLALITGETTYQTGHVGTPLHAVAGALSLGNPYRTPAVTKYNGKNLGNTKRSGWLLIRDGTMGDLNINHHMYIQQFVRRLRSVLQRYIGTSATANQIGLDPNVTAITNQYRAHYDIEVTTAKGLAHVDFAVTLTPPGMISEIKIDIRQSL